LKIVRRPMARRIGMIRPIAGGAAGKEEADAEVGQRLSAVSTARSRLRPRASSVSAAPALELAARLPCLATGTPQAATTRLTAVETLSVWCPSPPVPQTSMALAGASTAIMRARMAAPRRRSRWRFRPGRTGRRGRRGVLIGHAIEDRGKGGERSLLVERGCRDGGQRAHAGSGPDPADREEIGDHGVAMFGGDAFGVELHAVDRQAGMAEAHRVAVIGAGVDHEAFGHVLDDQRVIARGGERRGQPGEHAGAVVGDRRVLPCISPPRTTLPPKYWPIDWWPRHTPSSGTWACAAAPTRSRLIPLRWGCRAGREQEALGARGERLGGGERRCAPLHLAPSSIR
jgi:hypothetical protein